VFDLKVFYKQEVAARDLTDGDANPYHCFLVIEELHKERSNKEDDVDQSLAIEEPLCVVVEERICN
jgi:hypothetical protein